MATLLLLSKFVRESEAADSTEHLPFKKTGMHYEESQMVFSKFSSMDLY
ncbi:hypothetical protein CHCC20488_1339 [Bacillus paralicheniformis]|uniref:Uncharacterized protein n=1 Tax=Bacillus paralicheniformis TaxID=1648923 RepID=A0ABY3FTM0_9BACI|nr:hypothetical protein SC10_B2orf05274 [Bacillus paralicheniformis]ETB71811.1 hypothetical protein A943_08965 [Bacillus sp. CPSM8]KUL15571.1 hypothetical protein LI6934_19755 [Bacillus licheniformis LMG 6934]TWJ53661.1 hypothetical protein CHCC5023_4024 [Bacillus paralicheniformis]TWJ72008.1 hypothetical protein CHCC5019_0315 [Bacillus paralicheniformis]